MTMQETSIIVQIHELKLSPNLNAEPVRLQIRAVDRDTGGCIFESDDPNNLKFETTIPDQIDVYFNLLELNETSSDITCCSFGVLSLDSPGISLWNERNSIGGRTKVTLTEVNNNGTKKSLGSVVVDIVRVNPYKHNTDILLYQHDTNIFDQPVLVGHRGTGMNTFQRRLQLGENTIDSLQRAIDWGADFVEFDVQLAMDGTPVIYHDFNTWEWPGRSVNLIRSETFVQTHKKLTRTRSIEGLRRSLSSEKESMKPNGYGTISCPLTTLEDAFDMVATSGGFNIEIKYPSLKESVSENLMNFELNMFIDRILDVVFASHNGRRVYFSSFHIEACRFLCKKQAKFSVLLLTDGQTSDQSSLSVKEAAAVAKDIGCIGIVCNAMALLMSPTLIAFVKQMGLVVCSYGDANNGRNNVKVQLVNGINGIITDSIIEMRDFFCDA